MFTGFAIISALEWLAILLNKNWIIMKLGTSTRSSIKEYLSKLSLDSRTCFALTYVSLLMTANAFTWQYIMDYLQGSTAYSEQCMQILGIEMLLQK